MIVAFGEDAQRWAAGVEIDVDVVAADETAYLDAVAEAMRRRMRGEKFAIAVLLQEDPNRFVRAYGAEVLGAATDMDQRRAACGAIAMGTVVADGRRQMVLGGVTSDTLNLGRLLWSLSDTAVVISEQQYTRLATIFAHWHSVRVSPRQGDAEVPQPRGAREDPEQLVIWAGSRSADDFAVIACALEELHIPVYAVCDGGELPSTIHRCSIAQSEPLLRGAAAIIDTTQDWPGTSLALSAFGAPLAVARTSGALEFLDGAVGYDGWNRDSVLDAALRVLGASPPQRLAPASNGSKPAATVRDRAPLVSIVMPTRNRRAYLPFALESIANQDYPAVETIVISDGQPVQDIAERYGALTLHHDTPIDHASAWNAGIERARGEYIAFVDDDDLIFPDHISSLVETALVAGAAAVHGSSAIGHRGDTPGEFIGFSPGSLGGVDLEETLVNCPLIGMIASMVRRDVFTKIGQFDRDVTPNDDYEMILRIALTYDWVHADRVTYVYSRDGGYSHVSVVTNYGDLYERAYKRHPFPDRPLLAARRRQFIEMVRANGVVLNVVSARLPSPVILSPRTIVTGRS